LQEAHPRQVDPAALIAAGLLLLLCGVVVWDTLTLQRTAVYGIGPKAMPFVIAVGLGLLSVGNFVLGMQGPAPAREELNGTAIMRILGGTAALIAVIGYGGGFIIGTALLFAMTSSAFGRKAFFTDVLIGLALATIVFVIFAKLLALILPMGPLERLLI
jgi:putative tricarboxylic transport membrane protein